MPSLTAYTPYETLAFFQSVARHGADASAFEDIATALSADELVRENTAFDEKRLTASALQDLYSGLLKAEGDVQQPKVNGDFRSESSIPRKRKLSPSPGPNGEVGSTDEELVQTLVEKLYARFREEVTKEIKQDEEAYAILQSEIEELEAKGESQLDKVVKDVETTATDSRTQDDVALINSQRSMATVQDGATTNVHKELAGRNEKGRSASPAQVSKSSGSPHAVTASTTLYPPTLPSQLSPVAATPTLNQERPSAESNRASQPPPNTQQHSPGAFHRTLPPPSPQRSNYGPIPLQPGYVPGSQGHSAPMPYPMPPQIAPPVDFSNQKRPPSVSTPGRGSPMPGPPQPQYPGYPPYQQAPPWTHQMPPQHPYPQHSPYPNQPFYVQTPVGRHGPPYQTPHQSPYQHYPQTAPVHYPGQPLHGWHPQPGQPYYHPASAHGTPVPRAQISRPTVQNSGSSTPWKRKSGSSNNLRPPSPSRPEREVSPLTDTEVNNPGASGQAPVRDGLAPQLGKDDAQGSRRQSRTLRRGRADSTTPAALPQSRSQSLASFNSETPHEKPGTALRSSHIKTETPSTPAPVASDTDQGQRSSGRRGRPRNNTLTPLPDLGRADYASKRKRSIGRESSLTPALPSPANKDLRRQPPYDPSLVMVSKNFAKTAQLLLNEITSHKLAGIFAKPLSERDAPGYKDLVLRPQDLKSIKAAVSKGNRAAMAAIESLENEKDNEDSLGKPLPKSKGAATEGPLGNGMYMVKKSEELVPPRGIVNSSQMETELVRMFANAVMFNPLPGSERGFGQSLRIRKHGGDVDAMDDVEAETSDDGSLGDEGGIISDAREMFEDVTEQVRKWRDLEVERMGGDGGQSFRHGSVSVRQSSVSSAVAEEDTTGEAEVSVALGRKRRKIAVD